MQDPSRLEYARVNAEQLTTIQRAMELPENQAAFEIEFLPIDTPEQRQAAAEEWAAHADWEYDHYFYEHACDISPEAMRRLIEEPEKLIASEGYFVTAALLKVIRKKDGEYIEKLLSDYYGIADWPY